MTLSFMRADKALFSSESVTEGHPDKLCDQVSDAVLDALLTKDPMARVACETATTTGTVLVAGEITTTAYVDVIGIVREVVKDIGYTNAHYGFDFETCGVLTAIKPQSPDIAQGVDRAQDDRAELGAGDQGMMFGFAIDETPELMPLPITLAHAVAKQLATSRKSGELAYLRPDGKSQITVEYHKGQPKRVHTVVVATQHDDDVDVERIRRDVTEVVVRAAIPARLLDKDTRYVINGTGKFVIGGPMGDAGLTGRKIIVDTYGGFAPHGGGAFSGKDATKVDRSGAYAARYVAKNIVAAKLARRCQIQIAYVIGVAKPVSLNVETFGTGTVDDEVIRRLIDEHFDFRPQEIIERFDLRRPIYRQTAAYGHFGRPELDLPWERTDLAETFARSAGSRTAAV
ncbi:MAG: S-adenosylmethionine synthetase [Chloroflexota bacterium]|jgi:S-adenosylmethionine synthetase|nr:S-adenosylmethionine synthetase [Chloroflexota bacterium]